MEMHPIFMDDMQEVVESFIVETQEIFEELDNDLLLLESHADDMDLIDQVFRAVHTVKGTSGFLYLDQLGIVAHHFEDVLNRMRRQEIAVTPAIVDVMLAAFDLMKVLLQQVIDRDLQTLSLDHIIDQLSAISKGVEPVATPPKAADLPVPEEQLEEPTGEESVLASDEEKDDFTTEEPSAKETKRVAPAPVQKVASAGSDEAEGSDAASKGRSVAAQTIRVEVERLDSLMDLVGELVLGRNRLMQLVTEMYQSSGMKDVYQELSETSAQVDFITTELQAAVMHTRMVQVGRLFNKFPRLVRDLAKEFDKKVELVIEGEETELDKSLVEEISDPLVHLIRNSVDHGIEHPDERVAKGKPAQGRVRLAAAHEGSHIMIVIEDDGAGIDVEAVKAKALEKGLITEREAAEMSDNDAYQLLFKPGLSTAKKVSKVSGRGVGMDVVKTNLMRLNGTINIESVLGEGTRFILKLPLTLAIIQSLLVRVEQEVYAVPLHSVIEVVSLGKGDVQTIRGREVIRLREEVMPLVRVREILNVPSDRPRMDRGYAVVLGIANYRLGLMVDDLIGQKEIVIKPLGSLLTQVSGLAGSTILGDGRVIMILDVGELVGMERESRNGTRIHSEAA